MSRFPRNNDFMPEGWVIRYDASKKGFVLCVNNSPVAVSSPYGYDIMTFQHMDLVEKVLAEACTKEDEESARKKSEGKAPKVKPEADEAIDLWLTKAETKPDLKDVVDKLTKKKGD